MYVLIAYDVAAGRTEIFRKLLSRYLTHQQNSVFSGSLPDSEMRRLRAELSQVAEPGDRLMEVVAANRRNVIVSVLRKNEDNGALQAEEDPSHKQGAAIF